jgi:hypothetical protein
MELERAENILIITYVKNVHVVARMVISNFFSATKQ